MDPYNQVPTGLLAAIARQKLPRSAKDCLLLIVEKRFAWPPELRTDRISQRYLAEGLDLDRKTVRRGLAALQRAGILHISPGRGTRPSTMVLHPPATWGAAPLVGSPGPPGLAQGESLRANGIDPASGVVLAPASGGAGAPEVPARETERVSLWVGSIRRHLEQYPHPTTGQPKAFDLDAQLAKRFAAIALERELPPDLVACAAIDGWVALRGLTTQPGSDWNAWDHFHVPGIVAPAKLQTYLDAHAEARTLGWTGPLVHGAHRKRPPRRVPIRPELDDAQVLAVADVAAMSAEELHEIRKRAALAMVPGPFRDARLRKLGVFES